MSGHGGRRGDRSRSRDRPLPNRNQRGKHEIQVQPHHYKNGVPVVLNMFSVNIKSNDHVWMFQYAVQIHFARREKKLDADGNPLDPLEYEMVPRTNKDGDIRSLNLDEELTSTPLSRGVLLELQKQLYRREERILLTDGCHMAYAPVSVFDETESVRRFEVTIRDCDERHKHFNQAKRMHFLVQLTPAGEPIPLHEVMDSLQRSREESENLQAVRQCLNTLIRNVMMHSLISSGRSPRLFYLEEKTPEFLGNLYKYHVSRPVRKFESPNYSTPCLPYMGLSQTVEFCKGGNVFIKADARPSWFTADHEGVLKTGKAARTWWNYDMKKVLTGGRQYPEGLIAGIPVPDLNKYVPSQLRTRIEDELKSLRFDVEYERRKCNPDWVEKQRTKGKTEEEIAKMNKIVRPNQRAKKFKGEEAILWGADDPNLYSFEHSGKEFTVQTYFEEVMGVKIRYPKMPIVRTSYGYYPVEMLTVLKRKAYGPISPDQCLDVLAFHDEYSSSRKIEHIRNVRSVVNERSSANWLRLGNLMSMFNLSCSNEPLKMEAKLLHPPTLHAGNGELQIKQGSWSLSGKKFSRPSDLNSFAVLRLPQVVLSEEIVNGVLGFMTKEHGMSVPPHHDVAAVTVSARGTNLDELEDAFGRAIEKAKNQFLRYNNYYSTGTDLFQTKVITPNGGTENCVVVRKSIVVDKNILYSTHKILEKGANKRWCKARIMAFVSYRNGRILKEEPVDLLNLEMIDGHPRLNDELVKVEQFAWRVKGSDKVFIEEQLESVRPFSDASLQTQIECPAMVFVVMPAKNPAHYNPVKFLSQFVFGVPTQCLVTKTYQEQKKGRPMPRQYFSNVALKLNTKLFSLCNLGRAWTTHEKSSDVPQEGVPWVREMPTMVMGLVLSHAPTKAFSAVVGTVTLDKGCMQCAHELMIQEQNSTLIRRRVLREMTKNLAKQFKLHAFSWPQRILVYRDGVDDGKFDLLFRVEIASIRKAFAELNPEETERCPNRSECQGNGCTFCTPKITFVVCQNHHNIKITPDTNAPHFKGNVPSGTCVDEEIMPVATTEQNIPNTDLHRSKLMLLSDVNENGYDFLLTAQGGLKGTSRAVFYRVLLNENAYWKDPGTPGTALTKDKLEECTFQMSHQYGAATKAVRCVPVVHYSRKLANLAVGYSMEIKSEINKSEIKWINDPADPEAGEKEEAKLWVRDGDKKNLSMLPKFGPMDQSPRAPFRPNFIA